MHALHFAAFAVDRASHEQTKPDHAISNPQQSNHQSFPKFFVMMKTFILLLLQQQIIQYIQIKNHSFSPSYYKSIPQTSIPITTNSLLLLNISFPKVSQASE